jgi:hypothetical protein
MSHMTFCFETLHQVFITDASYIHLRAVQRRKGGKRSVLSEYVAQLKQSGAGNPDAQVREQALHYALAHGQHDSAAPHADDASQLDAQADADTPAGPASAHDADMSGRSGSGTQVPHAAAEHVAQPIARRGTHVSTLDAASEGTEQRADIEPVGPEVAEHAQRKRARPDSGQLCSACKVRQPHAVILCLLPKSVRKLHECLFA